MADFVSQYVTQPLAALAVRVNKDTGALLVDVGGAVISVDQVDVDVFALTGGAGGDPGAGGKSLADVVTALNINTAALASVLTALNLPISAKVNGNTLDFNANNNVGGASAAVTLPAVAAGDVGKTLRVTFGGTIAVTVNAPAGVTIADSSVAGSIADSTATQAGSANVTLQAVSTTHWIVVAFDGTWMTA